MPNPTHLAHLSVYTILQALFAYKEQRRVHVYILPKIIAKQMRVPIPIIKTRVRV